MVVAISPDREEDTVAGVLIVYDKDDPDVKLILNHLKTGESSSKETR